jgi:hypothetical protein
MNELTEGIDALAELRKMERDRLDERLCGNRERVNQEETFAPNMEEEQYINRDQLLKDYAAIIDGGIDDILRLKRVRDKMLEEFHQIEQILGKALGYPWYKDDLKNFPNATEADGVAVGDHTAWSLAHQAADRIKELQEQLDQHNARVHKLSLEE